MSIETDRTDDVVAVDAGSPGLTGDKADETSNSAKLKEPEDKNVKDKTDVTIKSAKFKEPEDKDKAKADKADQFEQNVKSGKRKKRLDKADKADVVSTPTADVGSFEGPDIIQNLKSYDPFADVDDDEAESKTSRVAYIHIRIQQRNGRKALTTIQGLPQKFDQKKILKVIKKKFACNGTTVSDPLLGEVIQLQGDQREDCHDFLVDKVEGLEMDSRNIKVHGF